MKSQGLQELVRDIFSNEEIKSQFIANPENVLSKFSLTENEKKTVLKTLATVGMLNSNSAQLDASIDPDSFWI
jgi:hypothetical protein